MVQRAGLWYFAFQVILLSMETLLYLVWDIRVHRSTILSRADRGMVRSLLVLLLVDPMAWVVVGVDPMDMEILQRAVVGGMQVQARQVMVEQAMEAPALELEVCPKGHLN